MSNLPLSGSVAEREPCEKFGPKLIIAPAHPAPLSFRHTCRTPSVIELSLYPNSALAVIETSGEIEFRQVGWMQRLWRQLNRGDLLATQLLADCRIV